MPNVVLKMDTVLPQYQTDKKFYEMILILHHDV